VKILELLLLVCYTDKIYQRQLKESHHADVPVSPVDSVCSQITQIGQHSNQVYNKLRNSNHLSVNMILC